MLISVIFNAVHALMYIAFFNILYKKMNRFLPFLMAVLYCLVVSLANYFSRTLPIQIGIIVNLLANLSMFFLFTYSITKEWRISLVDALYLYGFGFLSEEFVIYISVILLDFDFVNEGYTIHLYISDSIILGIFLIIYILMKPVRDYENLPHLFFITSLIYPAFFIILVYFLTYAYPMSSHPAASIIIIFVLPIQLFATIKANSLLYKHFRKAEMMKEEIRAYNYTFQQEQANNVNVRTMKHDLRKDKYMMYFMLRKGEVEQVINQLDKEITILDSTGIVSYTGISCIDSMLNMKAQEYAQEGIKLNVSHNANDPLRIDSFDLSYILGNLVDNAAEAVRRIENPNEADKEIIVFIALTMDVIVIKVENACYEKLEWEAISHPVSTKKGTGHGLGLYIIEEIVNQYKGSFKAFPENNHFIVEILLHQLNTP